jgi:solute carrier family 25 (mitochondrial aspartate/glutamate transporter), member 12/13
MFSTESHNQRQKAILAFNEYASVVANDSKFLSETDFAKAISSPKSGHYFTAQQASLLFRAADAQSKKQLSLDQFLEFEDVFAEPHSEYRILARLIDPQSSKMTVGSLKKYFNSPSAVAGPVNFASDSLKLSLGPDDKREITLNELSHLVKVIRSEKIKAQFVKLDVKKTGYITSDDLKVALASLAEHRLNPTLKENIIKNFTSIPYSEFIAIFSVLARSDTIAQILTDAKNITITNGITQTSFAKACLRHQDDQFTPLEVSTIFKMVNGGNTVYDCDLFAPLTDPSYIPQAPQSNAGLSAGMQTLKSIYNFMLGSIGGAVGAAVVYPIGTSNSHRFSQDAYAEPA